MTGPNGWSADPKSMPLEEGDAFVLHASDKAVPTGNVETERTKCRPSSHMIELRSSFSASSALPVDKMAVDRCGPSCIRKFWRSPWRSRAGKRDNEAAREAAGCRDASRCSSTPAFRSSGLNAECAPSVASAAKHHDHLWRVAKKGQPRDPTLTHGPDHQSWGGSSGCRRASSRADGSRPQTTAACRTTSADVPSALK